MNRSSGTLRSLWDGPRVHAQHVVSTERSFGITGVGNCIAGGNATALSQPALEFAKYLTFYCMETQAGISVFLRSAGPYLSSSVLFGLSNCLPSVAR